MAGLKHASAVMVSQETPVTVAIVEDDARVRQSLVQIINRAPGLACAGAFATGEGALAEMPHLNPRVVLMDINLPGRSGVECARQLKDLLPATRIIMLTVYEDSDHIFNSLAAGASGYLLKPARAAELLGAIQDVLSGGGPMSSHIARKVIESFQQRPASPAAPEGLSARELEVLEHLAQGYLYKEIAEKLNIGYATVHTHVARIYEKLHVRSRSQAVAKYLRP